MSIKTFFIRKAAAYIANNIRKWKKTAIKDQQSIMLNLVKQAQQTIFGKDHHFSSIKTYEDFKKSIPVRDYEDLRPYIDRVTAGESDILWPGKPKYFAKTSGTTSGVKYIPITKDSMPNHIATARNAMFNYFHQVGNADVFDGKLIFLSGPPVLESKGGVPTGRLSGIVNHEIPSWVKTNQLPSYDTNCIEDWESKLEKIVEETIHQDMRLISGIPPWVQMYFERILEKSGKKTIREVFPNYSLFMYGGVNFEPYRSKLEELCGKRTDSIETYPASEGFIAFQDDQVELNKDYALVINNNAGLWGYDIGDCVRFVSLDPYKIIVSGRVKHYISAFGEHVIGKEVEEAILSVAKKHHANIIEFTVAPQVNPPDKSIPYHEWFVEFNKKPDDMDLFSKEAYK